MIRQSVAQQGFQRIVRAIKNISILFYFSLSLVPHWVASKKAHIMFVFGIDNVNYLCYSIRAVESTGFYSLVPKNIFRR